MKIKHLNHGQFEVDPAPQTARERVNLVSLLEAAPELLAACQGMLPLLEHAEKCEASADDGNGERLRQLRRQLQDVRTVLAKVKQF